MQQTSAQPDFPASPIRDHVEMLHRLAHGVAGVLVVSVFNASLPSDKGVITHHRIGDVDDMVAAIEAHSGTPGANAYVGLQVMRRGLPRGARGTEKDIIAVLGLVADVDADTGKDAGEYPLPPNMVLETSPGNRQPFWMFDRPVAPAIAKAIARGLKAATGADHGTVDVTHVWRVPGTLNWPNATKLARGRSPDPATVNVVEPWDGTLTDPTALALAVSAHASSPEAEPVNLGDLPDVDGVEVSPEAARILGANDVGDRSAHAARVVEKLAFDGHPAEVAAALFLTATGNWLDRYASEDRARQDFTRMWARFGQPHVDARNAGGEMAEKLRQKAANDNEPSKAGQDRTADTFPGIMSSGDFVRGFVPPDYLIDGIVQSGFLYSITGQTGAGKTAVALLMAACISLGDMLAGQEVQQGRVLYFAGENPDDVRMRWIGLCHDLGYDPDAMDAHFVEGVFSISEFGDRIEEDVTRLGGVAAIFVDTTAAYFPGTDENSNVEMGNYARLLRSLTRMDCRPAVIAASHPVKNASSDALLPRGGGAFLNEVDGNLSLAKKGERTSELHWQGKFRGPDFRAIVFDLPELKVPTLVDSRGRQIPTVRARVVAEDEVAQRAASSNRDDELMLLAVRADGSRSLRDLAEFLGWMKDGEPDKRRAQSSTERLKRAGVIIYEVGTWRLTARGQTAATAAAQRHHQRETDARKVAAFVEHNRGKHRRTRGRTGNEATVRSEEND